MTNVNIYDADAERLEKLADEYDMTIADIVEELTDAADDILAND